MPKGQLNTINQVVQQAWYPAFLCILKMINGNHEWFAGQNFVFSFVCLFYKQEQTSYDFAFYMIYTYLKFFTKDWSAKYKNDIIK